MCSQYIKKFRPLVRLSLHDTRRIMSHCSHPHKFRQRKYTFGLTVIPSNYTIERRLHVNIIQVNMGVDTYTSREEVNFASGSFSKCWISSKLPSLKKECPVFVIRLIRPIFGGIVTELSRIHSFCEFANRGLICIGKKRYLFADEFYTTVRVQTSTILNFG